MRSLFLWFACLLSAASAHAFPEMVRNGYVNCSSCHVSLTGGGVLTEYGREISAEKLAIWKSASPDATEHHFAYGALDSTGLQKWLFGGGDVRAVYVYQNDPFKQQGRSIFMQADLEAAAVKGPWTADATIGVDEPVPGRNVEFAARRHYLQYRFNDQFATRGGKFIPAYGINTPDHVTLTRSPLRLGYLFESYNLEGSYLSEQWNVFATALLGTFDTKQALMDRGGALQVAFAPTERIKVGVNSWYGRNELQERWLHGIFGLVTVAPELLFQTEVDYQTVLGAQRGLASTQKLSYELRDGLWLYGLQEWGKSDFSLDPTAVQNYGIGLQIFPRSHFEFNLAYTRSKIAAFSPDFFDYAYFMSHFYF